MMEGKKKGGVFSSIVQLLLKQLGNIIVPFVNEFP